MDMRLLVQVLGVATAVTAMAVAAAFWSSWAGRRRLLTTAELAAADRPRGTRRGATSPALLLPLLLVGGWAIVMPGVESRRVDAVDGALAEAARRVVTSQRAHVARTGDFFAGRRWLSPGQHGALVLPLEPSQRVLTYYTPRSGGLVVMVADVEAGRLCEAVVRMRAGDRPASLRCGEERVE